MTISVRIPDEAWPVDPEYLEYYTDGVRRGNEIAAASTARIVAIARNSMPMLANSLVLMAATAQRFAECKIFIYENDSDDGTDKMLDAVAGELFTIRHESLGGEDARGFQPERTIRLAYCRNQCLEWVRQNPADYTIVVDTDAACGFSIDGVMNSLARLHDEPLAGGIGSYSLYSGPDGIAQYDSWAARPTCWWRDRREEVGFTWFSSFMPPVGSPMLEMNSCFGGLAVYRTEAFLQGGYAGGDCEHVPHHRRMRDAGYKIFLNPGCRYIAMWNDEAEEPDA